MNKWIKNVFSRWNILLLALFLTSPLYAQTDFSLTYYLIRDDNSFKNRSLYDEWINTFSLYTGHTFTGNSSLLRLYYSGDYSTFANYKDRQNNSHRIGFALNPYTGRNNALNLGGSARIRRNKADYIYYNVDIYNFYANFRYGPELTKIYTVGFNLEKNKFKEFSDIDNLEYRFWARYQQFFQNRLSLMGEFGLGVKDYVNQKKIEFFGFTPGLLESRPRYTEETLNAILFSGLVNMGKSLTPKTGINLRLGGQWYVSDPIEAYSDGVYYYTENDLYDDPYSYQNNFAGINLTRLFAVGFQGKIGVEYQKKDYRGTPALTIDGDLSGNYRKDTRVNYSLILTKTFLTGWRVPNTFDLFFRFLMRKNASNDPYYDYFDHLGMVGITVGLKSF